MREQGYRIQMRGGASKYYTRKGVCVEAAAVYSEFRMAELEYAGATVPVIWRGGRRVEDAFGEPVLVQLPTSPKEVWGTLLDAGAVAEEHRGVLKAYLDLGDGLAERVL
jgi:hypothetical protein